MSIRQLGCALQRLSEHIACQVRTSAGTASSSPAAVLQRHVRPEFLNIGQQIPTSGYRTAVCELLAVNHGPAATTWTRNS